LLLIWQSLRPSLIPKLLPHSKNEDLAVEISIDATHIHSFNTVQYMNQFNKKDAMQSERFQECSNKNLKKTQIIQFGSL
jgi:hypothetical protein